MDTSTSRSEGVGFVGDLGPYGGVAVFGGFTQTSSGNEFTGNVEGTLGPVAVTVDGSVDFSNVNVGGWDLTLPTGFSLNSIGLGVGGIRRGR